ncbi:YIP1 family protein [Paracoccus aminophilus]|uniref:Yip1 domain-containing protein n=1 Tax=Paracoccus aminophilus JCM 7686 TaxID=1367847 RepID=S5XV65_PARAH|nr:YIP1 family protein [Paracoccus aminophilus]AGT09112.1 hypothetical protein JCM7686_2031 [Paracoccus aminophilus JCM 7686]
MTFTQIGELAVLTLREPARGFRALQGLGLPIAARWMLLVLAIALSALLAGVANWLFPTPITTPLTELVAQPWLLAAVQFVAMTATALLITFVGRLFGGRGSFEDALLVTAWIELLLVAVQAVQVVLMLVLPLLAGLFSLVAFALFFYLIVTLTKALHGFQNGFLVLLTMVGTLFVVGFALTFLALAMGIPPEVLTHEL